MTTTQKSDIIRKVQKLLNLGKDKAAFQDESNTAMALASQLLEQHGLSMKDIEFADGHVKESEFAESHSKHMALWPWEKTLAVCVTFIMPVHVALANAGRGYHRFVWFGTKGDVEMAHALWEHLRLELKRLARPEATPLEKRSFLTGAVHVLCNRAKDLEKQRQQANAQVADGKALMVVKKNDVMAWVRKTQGDMGRAQMRGSDLDHEAYARGKQAGNNIPLGPKRQELGYSK